MPPLSPAARAHRADLTELVRLAEADLSVVFRKVTNAELVKGALNDILPKLVALYGSAAASLAADWYEEQRVKAEVRGRFQAITAELPTTGRTEALAGFAVGPLYGAKPDAALALVKASGGLQRIIFNADRYTVMGSSVKDPRARGWQREGNGECQFCALLISRGAVYTEGSVDFESHDRCRCVGVPAFD